MNDQQLLALLVLLSAGLSFLMSGMEAGVLALSPLRIRQLKRAGNPRAEALHRFMEKPENFLWTILVGNAISSLTVMSYVVLLSVHWFKGQMALRIGFFVLFVFLFYTVCELLPKMLFRLYPNRLCLMLAQPFRAVHFILSPIVALVAWFSRGLLRWTGGKRFTGNIFGNRDELRLVMQESAQALSTEEKGMINRVLDLQTRSLRQITIPWANVVAVTTDTPMAEVLKLAREKKLTRFPVWKAEASGQRIVGIVNLKTVLYSPELDASKPAGDYVRPAVYLGEDLRLEEVLNRMRRGGQRLAIVLGRDQREIGIVSLQDILKTIVGEVNL